MKKENGERVLVKMVENVIVVGCGINDEWLNIMGIEFEEDLCLFLWGVMCVG